MGLAFCKLSMHWRFAPQFALCRPELPLIESQAMLKVPVTSLVFVAALLLLTCAHAAEALPQAPARVIVEPKYSGLGCKMPDYPSSALRKEETGVVSLGFLISAAGNVEQAKIINTSGVSALDQGALVPLSKCLAAPGTIDGKPAAMWIGFDYQWSLEGGEEDSIAETARRASTGNLPALYALYYLLKKSPLPSHNAKAEQILHHAANKGNTSAQYQLGLQLSGKVPGFAIDQQKAGYWLGKAADGGHVVAKQVLDYWFTPTAN